MPVPNIKRADDYGSTLLLAPTRTRGRCNTRLTREGYHFVFLMFFVFLGAIIRDVNLLVILGGLLMAMLLVQWRLCSRTLNGIVAERILPEYAQARLPFLVEIRVTNPRRWLGAWLLVVEDQMRLKTGDESGFGKTGPNEALGRSKSSSSAGQTKIDWEFERKNQSVSTDRTDGSSNQRVAKFLARSISLVIPHLLPRSASNLDYQCTCQHRGIYQFEAMEVSTRFPISLMRGCKQLCGSQKIIVQPAIGEILPSWRELFEVHRFGTRRQRAQAGVTEGEFYGLRAYRPGDSQRWIHWRTSAKRNELAVRQFERQELYEACIVVDLFQPEPWTRTEAERANDEELIEKSIEFVASLMHFLIGHRLGSASVVIATNELLVAPRIQSRPQLAALLDQFATIHGNSSTNWSQATEALTRELKINPHLIVISTRAAEQHSKSQGSPSNLSNALLNRIGVRWLDVSTGELERYFRRSRL